MNPIVKGGCEKKKLEYLDFVQVGAIYMIICFSSFYDYAKESSGPLKSGVKTVEATTLNNAYEPTTKEFYFKCEPLAEQYPVSAWRSLNQHPLFPQVVQMIIPTAAYWCEKYNEAVAYTAQRGYTVSQCLPVVPIERIGKVFSAVSLFQVMPKLLRCQHQPKSICCWCLMITCSFIHCYNS
ncbi:unnamed protein product [Coffea canephora]|uniref:Uncharacterized protein n=1 Tax=Coffea canephora TaxID=49390 RepID=A0A068U5B5_COFCA|nr:unnamed protein product [Coffea canephora]